MRRVDVDLDKSRLEQVMQKLSKDQQLSAAEIIKRYNGMLSAARLLDNPLYQKYNETYQAQSSNLDPTGFGRKTVESVISIAQNQKSRG